MIFYLILIQIQLIFLTTFFIFTSKKRMQKNYLDKLKHFVKSSIHENSHSPILQNIFLFISFEDMNNKNYINNIKLGTNNTNLIIFYRAPSWKIDILKKEINEEKVMFVSDENEYISKSLFINTYPTLIEADFLKQKMIKKSGEKNIYK